MVLSKHIHFKNIWCHHWFYVIRCTLRIQLNVPFVSVNLFHQNKVTAFYWHHAKDFIETNSHRISQYSIVRLANMLFSYLTLTSSFKRVYNDHKEETQSHHVGCEMWQNSKHVEKSSTSNINTLFRSAIEQNKNIPWHQDIPIFCMNQLHLVNGYLHKENKTSKFLFNRNLIG
jgi:hypothetical protein